MKTLTTEFVQSVSQKKIISEVIQYDGEEMQIYLLKPSEWTRGELESRMLGPDGKPLPDGSKRLRLEYLSAMVCDADGNLLFTDREQLKQLPAELVAPIADKCFDHCGWFSKAPKDNPKKKLENSGEASG